MIGTWNQQKNNIKKLLSYESSHKGDLSISTTVVAESAQKLFLQHLSVSAEIAVSVCLTI